MDHISCWSSKHHLAEKPLIIAFLSWIYLFSMGRRLFKVLGTFYHHVLWHTVPVCETGRWEQQDWVSPSPGYCLQNPLRFSRVGGRLLIPSFNKHWLNASFEWEDVKDSGKINTRTRLVSVLQEFIGQRKQYRVVALLLSQTAWVSLQCLPLGNWDLGQVS